MGIISEKINAKIKALKEDFDLNKKIKHQGVKGSFNEIEITSLIKEVIPNKYNISRGIIENCKGEQSNETDFFIYDDEILPPYIKSDLTFVPIEAVKYAFEVKSTLNSTELKTTISKFKHFSSIGGTSPTVLYSFSSDIQGSELERYFKNDNQFYTYPSIMALCVSNKGYYFKSKETHYLKDHMSIETFINQFLDSKNNIQNLFKESLDEILKNDKALNELSRSQFALIIKNSILYNDILKNLNEKKLTINDINYSDITFNIHRWIGIESSENVVEMSLLSGISNTLCQKKFGTYLLFDNKIEYKVFSICYEDMWGNISLQDFNRNGLDYDSNNVNYTLTLTEDKNNKIIFKRKDEIEDK